MVTGALKVCLEEVLLEHARNATTHSTSSNNGKRGEDRRVQVAVQRGGTVGTRAGPYTCTHWKC